MKRCTEYISLAFGRAILWTCLSLLVSAYAAESKAEGGAKMTKPMNAANKSVGADDKVDVSELENKYWSAKDTDFGVVQNRLYSKANRLSVYGNIGTLVNDPWNQGYVYGGGVGYYISDRLGFEFNYELVDSSDNKALKKLSQQAGYPNNNKVKDYIGGSVVWVPFYAKMSVMNWRIIYFDMSFGVGAGMQNYQQQMDTGNITRSTTAVAFDVAQQFYLTRNFALRIDLRNRWYRADTAWFNSNSAILAGSRTASTDTENTTTISMGLTVLF
jgi:outer membrane beta-barrel protein